MRLGLGLGICLALTFASGVQAADGTARFDGTWDTTLSCNNAAGALAYAYQFSSTVKDGVLHAERGTQAKPGWLELDGNIGPDGAAKIHAKGLVGSQNHALEHRPAGSPYAYHLVGKFSDQEGTGKRVGSRPCNVTFKRQ
jgi:hypothetical protein